MPRKALQPELNQKLLEPCLSDPCQTSFLLAKIADSITPAVVFPEGADTQPLSVKIRHVTSNGFQLFANDDDPEACRRLEAGNGFFVGFHGRYKIQFKIPSITRHVSLPGNNVTKQTPGIYFDCSFPQQIWRINRREEFRAIPSGPRSVYCEVRPTGGRKIVAKALDMSAGGVCLEVPDGAIDVAVGTVLLDCTLRQGENVRVVPCSLVVRTIDRTNSPARSVHIGCKVRLKNTAYSGEYQAMNFEVQLAERLEQEESRLKLV